MQLNQSQVDNIAKHFTDNLCTIVEFFEDPVNQEAYRKWYREKYGCESDKENNA